MGIRHNAYIITYRNRSSKIPRVNFSNDTSSFMAAHEANYAAIRQRNGQVVVKALNVNGEDGHQNWSRLILLLMKRTLALFFCQINFNHQRSAEGHGWGQLETWDMVRSCSILKAPAIKLHAPHPPSSKRFPIRLTMKPCDISPDPFQRDVKSSSTR